MATCKQCREFEKCKDDAFINGAKFDPNESAKYCTGFEPITNADRIRAMSDEELAVFVRAVIMAEDCPVTGCDCDKCFLKEVCFNGSKWRRKEVEWLKQPAEQKVIKNYKKVVDK